MEMAVPYQRHNKANQLQQRQKEISSSSFDYKILQKPFWIWDKKHHLASAQLTEGQCCWNHIVGLPQKNGKEYPLFHYERTLFNALMYNNHNENKFQNKHLWIKKATGLGITEFMLRIMGWLCTSRECEIYGSSQGQM